MMRAPQSHHFMHPVLGDFGMRRVDPAVDSPLIHEWVTAPKARYWMMQDAAVADVWAEQEAIAASSHRFAYLGLFRYRARFLVEVYDPARSELAGVYASEEGDAGMHVLTAPAETAIPGFTRGVMTAVMDLLFNGFGARRAVVEPDAGNEPIHRLNEYVGFRVERTVELSGKRALLSLCTRADFEASAAKGAQR